MRPVSLVFHLRWITWLCHARDSHLPPQVNHRILRVTAPPIGGRFFRLNYEHLSRRLSCVSSWGAHVASPLRRTAGGPVGHPAEPCAGWPEELAGPEQGPLSFDLCAAVVRQSELV